MSEQLSAFLQGVAARPSTEMIFNPWRDTDPLNDVAPQAPELRLHHLMRYMTERQATAKLLLIAEAPGYQGAKFSGLAMTSERRLIEHLGDKPYFDGCKHRTSKPVLSNGKAILDGSLEPTATIVWNAMLDLCGSHDFVLWNSFAWHPHHAGELLTNRTPTDEELRSGLPTLEAFLAAFPGRQVVAVGRKCEVALGELGVACRAVRHPANGGATKFRDGVRQILTGG